MLLCCLEGAGRGGHIGQRGGGGGHEQTHIVDKSTPVSVVFVPASSSRLRLRWLCAGPESESYRDGRHRFGQSLAAASAGSRDSHAPFLRAIMPLSEIDHIFASKPKRRLSAPSTSTDAPDKQSKGAKRKRGRTAETGVVAHGLQSAKRRAPETVLDPSVRIAAASKKNKAAAGTAIKKRRKPDTEDEDRFKDSRGAGPSMLLRDHSFFPFVNIVL